jgi:hypothetical protein
LKKMALSCHISRKEKLFQFTIFRLNVLVDCRTKEGMLNVSLLSSLTCSQILLSLLASDDYDDFVRIEKLNPWYRSKKYSFNFVKVQMFKETGQILILQRHCYNFSFESIVQLMTKWMEKLWYRREAKNTPFYFVKI